MKFLANENVPLASVSLLRQRGIDVTYVAEDCSSETDRAIMRMAQEQGRIIITFDRDYGELIFKQRQPPPAGILFLRFDPDYPTEPGEIIARLIESGTVPLLGKFTVVERDKLRQRPIPRHDSDANME
jgi:predicted nuclease of predicted toxin-antitoxin system